MQHLEVSGTPVLYMGRTVLKGEGIFFWYHFIYVSYCDIFCPFFLITYLRT